MAAHYQESIDDDPLPNEQKILALHQIDPDILPWIKRTYEKALDQQHEYNIKQLEAKSAMDKSDRKDRAAKRAFRWMATISASIILLGCCAGGGYLIYLDKPGGAAMLGVPVMLTIGALISNKVNPKGAAKGSEADK